MFNYSYHLTPTKKVGVVKLRPTTGTYLKAFGPAVLIWVGLASYGAISNFKDERDLKKNSSTPKKQ